MSKTASNKQIVNRVDSLTHIIYLQNIGITEAVKDTGITKQDLKYLAVGYIQCLKSGYFEIKGIERALRAKCGVDIRLMVIKLMPLGYIEKIAGRKFGSRIGRKYITTGKTEYLIKKYNAIMNRLLNEVNQ